MDVDQYHVFIILGPCAAGIIWVDIRLHPQSSQIWGRSQSFLCSSGTFQSSTSFAERFAGHQKIIKWLCVLNTMDLSQIPSGPPPLGVDSNFVDPPTQAPVIKITISVLLSLMILFVSFRLYTKIWILNKMEISDCQSTKRRKRILLLMLVRCLQRRHSIRPRPLERTGYSSCVR